MKPTTLIIILAVIVAVTGCNTFIDPLRDHIEQSVTKDEYPYMLCGTRTCIATLAWFNKDIVWSKYIPITSNDSVIHADSVQASTILKNKNN